METDVKLSRRYTLAAALAFVATGASTATAQTGKAMTTPTGLQITDTKVGTGDAPFPTAVSSYWSPLGVWVIDMSAS